MSRFYTKFNLPNRTLREMDSHDNVDRLSYVDTTVMINRFIQAGKLLQLRNRPEFAMYTTPESIEEGVGIPCQVYPTDPVIASKTMEVLQSQIDEQVKLAETVGSVKHSETVPPVAGESTPAVESPAE